MANLNDDLDKAKSKRIKEQEASIRDAKQLLSPDAAREKEILTFLGLDAHIREVENKNRLHFINKVLEEKYEGKPYHISEIQGIGMKYRLFLKKANLYQGSIPNDLGKILLQLKEKHNLHIDYSDSSDKGKFYILAAPKLFLDYYPPKSKLNDLMDGARHSFISSARLSVDTDPALFYKADDEHYILIKNWGNNFNLLRRFYGYFTARFSRLRLIAFAAIPVALWIMWHVGVLVDSLWLPPLNGQGHSFWECATVFFYAVACAAAFVWYIFILASLLDTDKQYSLQQCATEYFYKKPNYSGGR